MNCLLQGEIPSPTLVRGTRGHAISNQVNTSDQADTGQWLPWRYNSLINIRFELFYTQKIEKRVTYNHKQISDRFGWHRVRQCPWNTDLHASQKVPPISFFPSISDGHSGTLFMGRDEGEAHQEGLRVGLFLIQTQEDLSGEISVVEETLKHNIQKERSLIFSNNDPVSSAELSLDNSIAVQRQTRNPEVAVCKMISLRYERSRGTHRR